MLTITYYALLAYTNQVIRETLGRDQGNGGAEKIKRDNYQADVHSNKSAYRSRPRENV